MLIVSWDVSWNCLSEHLHVAAQCPYRTLADLQEQEFYITRGKLFISFLLLCNKSPPNLMELNSMSYLTVSLGQESEHVLVVSSVSGSLTFCNQGVNLEFSLPKV